MGVCVADAAACAPTQLATTKKLPLSYPYHYLRNARDNHMPGTMWGYSQLYGSPDGGLAWNADVAPGNPDKWHSMKVRLHADIAVLLR